MMSRCRTEYINLVYVLQSCEGKVMSVCEWRSKAQWVGRQQITVSVTVTFDILIANQTSCPTVIGFVSAGMAHRPCMGFREIDLIGSMSALQVAPFR